MSESKVVITGVGFIVQVKLGVLPVEFPCIDDYTADTRSMAADPFCQGIDDDVSPVLNAPEQIGRCKGGIDDQRQFVASCNSCHGFDIGEIKGRIADGFNEYRPRTLVDCRFEILWVARVDKSGMDIELR